MGKLATVPADISSYSGTATILAATDESGNWHVVVMANGKKCEAVFMGPYAKDITDEYIKSVTNWLRKANAQTELCGWKYITAG